MTVKLAISLPDQQVEAARRAVAEGRAASVSAFVSAAIERTQREDGLMALLDDLDQSHGTDQARERKWW